MCLVQHELRKLIRTPMIWIFLLLCLLANLFFICTDLYERDGFHQISQMVKQTGQRMGDSFTQILYQQPKSEWRDILLEATVNPKDIFEEFQMWQLSGNELQQSISSDIFERWQAWKYRLLQPRIKQMADEDVSLDVYAGVLTHGSHMRLFGTVLRAVTGEAACAGMLFMLHLFGYERLYGTEALLATAKTGRRICRAKIIAGLFAAAAGYLLLAVSTLAVYFSLWDYNGLWGANVSSQFNYIVQGLRTMHFVTWTDFTVAGYLAATLALGMVFTLVVSLPAAAVGMLCRNTYLGALGLFAIILCSLAVPFLCADLKLWVCYAVSMFLPIVLWFQQAAWFTEQSINAILPWQETIGVCGNLLLSSGICMAAWKRYKRKDLS